MTYLVSFFDIFLYLYFIIRNSKIEQFRCLDRLVPNVKNQKDNNFRYIGGNQNAY